MPVIMPKNVLTVSRKWHAPEISHKVTLEGIEISIPLEDYLTALVAEVGNPALILTAKSLQKALDSASLKVVQGIKDETAKVV